jgi:molecular chaperone DnaJ
VAPPKTRLDAQLMTTRESYRILGIKAKADMAEVRSRFRILAQKYHPDLNPENSKAAEQFRRVVEAYEKVQAHLAKAPRGEKKYYRSSPSAKKDFFEEVMGMDLGEDASAPAVGPDFRYDFGIPFEAALDGLRTTITVPHLMPCETCGGAGRVPIPKSRICPDCRGKGCAVRGPGLFRGGPDCKSCRGKGRITDEACPACGGQGYREQWRHFHLDIPAGTEDGARLRFAGQGGNSCQGGPPGNLEVVISVAPHEFFTRKGRDLHCQFEVTFAQAVLGGEVRVPTLRGYATLNLPRGTRSGSLFCFPAAGLPGTPDHPAGDQIIEVVVAIPKDLARARQEISEELARMGKSEIDRAAHE